MTYSVTLAEAIRHDREQHSGPVVVGSRPPELIKPALLRRICGCVERSVIAEAIEYLQSHGYTVTPPAPEPVDPRSEALARAMRGGEGE